MSRRPSIMRCGLLLSLLVTGIAHAAPRSYELGLEALEGGDFSAAERYLHQALREDPSPGGRYHPYFYLGVVRLRLNDCPGAMVEWQQAERRGKLPDKLQEELRSYRKFCSETGNVEAINRDTEAVMESVHQVQREVQKLHDQLRQAGQWTQELEDRNLELLGQVARAERNLKEAQRPPWRTREAQDAEAAAQKARDMLETAFQQAQVQWADYQESLRQQTPPDDDGKDQIVDDRSPKPNLDKGKGKSKVPPPPLAVQPPEPLLEAADALFAGNYGLTLEILDGQSFNDPEAEAQANLFRAAAHFALYLTGVDGPDHRQIASNYAAEARRYDPALSPLARVFSPRFRDFFREANP